MVRTNWQLVVELYLIPQDSEITSFRSPFPSYSVLTSSRTTTSHLRLGADCEIDLHEARNASFRLDRRDFWVSDWRI